MVTAANTG